MTTDIQTRDERLQKGLRTGITGMILNGLLALGKLTVGFMYGNNAILTDGVNNLTDVGTSAAATAGFALSRKKADTAHPADYSRMEYICGLFVSFVLCLSALSLMKSAVTGCMTGFVRTAVVPSYLLAAVLSSTIVKLFLAVVSSVSNTAVKSDLLKGMAADSFIDCGMTVAAVAAAFVSPLVMLPLDAVVSIPGAVYIGVTGVKLCLSNIRKLL